MTTREWFRKMRAADWNRSDHPMVIIWFRTAMAHHRECPINGPYVLQDLRDVQEFLAAPREYNTTPYGAIYGDIERSTIGWKHLSGVTG